MLIVFPEGSCKLHDKAEQSSISDQVRSLSIINIEIRNCREIKKEQEKK